MRLASYLLLCGFALLWRAASSGPPAATSILFGVYVDGL